MTIAFAAFAAAVLASAGPLILRRLPEPPEPEPDKVPYADLATWKPLGFWLAAAAAGYAGLAAWWIPDHRLLPTWVLLAAVGGLLAWIDWNTHLLPFLIVAPTFVATWVLTALSAWWIQDAHILLRALLGNIIVFGTFVALHILANLFFGGAFGYGDVRLSAVLGVVFGPLPWQAGFAGIYAGFVLGAIVGLIRQRGRLRGGPPLAFGPFMIIGAVLGLLLA